MKASAASVGERDAALRMLAGRRPPTDRDRAVERFQRLISIGALDPAGLFVVRGGSGAILGSILVSVMPGALGLAWPPCAVRRNRSTIEDSLVNAACAWLRGSGVKVCQAFAGNDDPESFAALPRAGFPNPTRLVELRRAATGDPPPIRRLAFEVFSESNRAAFLRTLLATFEGSLDCPEANGARSTSELLAGYEELPTDDFHLVRSGDEPAGGLLLNESANGSDGEIAYLGLAPNFRGRGLGSELVSFARGWSMKLGHAALALSVDERNAPAIRIYETHGFQASGARSVFLASWSEVS